MKAYDGSAQPVAALQVADSAQSLGAGGLKIAMSGKGRCRQLDGSAHSMPGQSPIGRALRATQPACDPARQRSYIPLLWTHTRLQISMSPRLLYSLPFAALRHSEVQNSCCHHPLGVWIPEFSCETGLGQSMTAIWLSGMRKAEAWQPAGQQQILMSGRASADLEAAAASRRTPGLAIEKLGASSPGSFLYDSFEEAQRKRILLSCCLGSKTLPHAM